MLKKLETASVKNETKRHRNVAVFIVTKERLNMIGLIKLSFYL